MKPGIEKLHADGTGVEKPGTGKRSRGRKLGWFGLIWALSVAAIATVGYGLRALVSFIYGS